MSCKIEPYSCVVVSNPYTFLLYFQPPAKLQAKRVFGVPVAEEARPRPLEGVQEKGEVGGAEQCRGDDTLPTEWLQCLFYSQRTCWKILIFHLSLRGLDFKSIQTDLSMSPYLRTT